MVVAAFEDTKKTNGNQPRVGQIPAGKTLAGKTLARKTLAGKTLAGKTLAGKDTGRIHTVANVKFLRSAPDCCGCLS